jgi:hypothetical protein
MSDLAVERVTLSATSILPNSSSSNAPSDVWKQLPQSAVDAWHHAVQFAKAAQDAGWQPVSPNAEAGATAQAPHSSANSEAFEVAAQRMRQAVQPVGGRQEGAITAWINRQGDRFRGQVVDMLRHPEYLIGPGELGAPLIGAFKPRLSTVGPVALGGVRSGEKAAVEGAKEITKAAESANRGASPAENAEKALDARPARTPLTSDEQAMKVKAQEGKPISGEGIATIERHLSRLDALDWGPNQEMIARLRAGLAGGDLTAQDLNYYKHELIESGLVDQGVGLREAHLETLKLQGIAYEPGYERQIYAPSVLNKYRAYFNDANFR